MPKQVFDYSYQKLWFQRKNFQLDQKFESFFESISSCDIEDDNYISKSVEIIEHFENLKF